MRCQRIARWLKDNPGQPVAEELLGHSAFCPECHKVMEEQRQLEQELSLLPAVEPPPFFGIRLKAAVASAGQACRPAFYPWGLRLLPPLVATLVIVAASLLIVYKKPDQREAVVRSPDQIVPSPETPVAPANPIASPVPSSSVAIYPVWPNEGDAVEGDDVSIMATVYPAPGPETKITMTLNNLDVSPSIKAEGEILSYQPGRLGPGRYEVTISLEEPDGQRQSLSYSFYALEAQS